MQKDRAEEIEYQLEILIDEVGLTSVLEMISGICYDKAEHLRSNWQDSAAAKQWEKDGAEIQILSCTVD